MSTKVTNLKIALKSVISVLIEVSIESLNQIELSFGLSLKHFLNAFLFIKL